MTTLLIAAAFQLLAPDNDRLPDGKPFPRWEQPVTFTRTYHVAQDDRAADTNPGTADKPFRTIQRAADVLHAGERVVIESGTYRECVRPARGGTGPAVIISYEAAPGATVVITGAETYRGKWVPSDFQRGAHKVWMTQLSRSVFPEGNPFSLLFLSQFEVERLVEKNKPIPQDSLAAAMLYRGMIFQDGHRLQQGSKWAAVHRATTGGVFWVAEDGLTLHLRTLGDLDPNSVPLEITTRQQCFAPDARGLAYIRVQGLTMEKAANGGLRRQGLLCVNGGHHWLIASNTVRWANGAGIDLGRQNYLSDKDTPLGDCIVRANHITDCGVNGIAGTGGGGGRPYANLIEANTLISNCWQEVESLQEGGAIKVLLNGDTLIRQNYICDTLHAPGIWIDFANVNTRCTGNVIVNTTTQWGAIFIEASVKPNQIDHNFIWNTTGAGLYQHDCNDQIFSANFIGHSSGPGIKLVGKVSDRTPMGLPITGGPNIVTGNILFANQPAILDKGPPSDLTGNLTEGVQAEFDLLTNELTWSTNGGATVKQKLSLGR